MTPPACLLPNSVHGPRIFPHSSAFIARCPTAQHKVIGFPSQFQSPIVPRLASHPSQPICPLPSTSATNYPLCTMTGMTTMTLPQDRPRSTSVANVGRARTRMSTMTLSTLSPLHLSHSLAKYPWPRKTHRRASRWNPSPCIPCPPLS